MVRIHPVCGEGSAYPQQPAALLLALPSGGDQPQNTEGGREEEIVKREQDSYVETLIQVHTLWACGGVAHL